MSDVTGPPSNVPSACQPAIAEIWLEHKLLEKDVKQLEIMSEKLSDTIIKIQEMNSNLCTLIKLHEDWHDRHDKDQEISENTLVKLAEKIEALNKETHEKINTNDQIITEKFDIMKKELSDHRISSEPLLQTLRGETQEEKDRRATIKDLEHWKWMIVGGAIVMGILFGHLSWDFLAKLFR